ncbi:MAG: AI-2E family transporter [Pyrinomonadaceae bacterium]
MEERRNQLRWIALMVAAAVAVYLCWLMLQPFVDVILWAAVLVILFYPVHRRIVARTKSPGWSALLSSLLVIATILIPLTLVTLAVVNEMAGVAQNLQNNIATLLDPNSPASVRILKWLGRYVNVEELRSQQYIVERLKGLSGQIAGRTLGIVGGLVGIIVEIFFVIFTMFYFFRDGESIRDTLRDVLPLKRAQSHEIFARTRDIISASVYGVVIIAAIQGALGGLAFWVLGLPSALVWGVVMLFLSMIPLAGSFVVWVPAAIFLAVTGHWGKAIILTAWGAVVIGSVDNFLRPKLVGEKTKLHELLIFFSVLGGLQVFGVLGLVIGPVIVAVTLALMDVFRQIDRPASETLQEPTTIEEQSDVSADAATV